MPERATLLARDMTPLAEGPERTSDVPDVAINVVGNLGPVPAERAEEVRALGWPSDARVGINGLERALDTRLAGTPGGVLRVGSTVLARREPKKAAAVRTTISIPIERAAVAALGSRLGGVVAIEPRTGELLAFAGIAFSGLQPPGSTMKILTVTAGLEEGITSLDTSYPVESFTTLEGVQLENANGEQCGGTLTATFAESCNSVFAPMGAKLGAEKLVDVAERFGFNRAPDILGAATPAIPQPVGDRRRAGGGLVRDRAGTRPGHCALDGDRRGDDRAPRRPARADARVRPAAAGCADNEGHEHQGRPDRRETHARRGPRGHRPRRGYPGHQGGGQDRYR